MPKIVESTEITTSTTPSVASEEEIQRAIKVTKALNELSEILYDSKLIPENLEKLLMNSQIVGTGQGLNKTLEYPENGNFQNAATRLSLNLDGYYEGISNYEPISKIFKEV
uniref:Uncharacterized protein n=1 Tax=Panagrolaimus davidi TaxID=227884 RepID=A0A914QNL6_9BILA